MRKNNKLYSTVYWDDTVVSLVMRAMKDTISEGFKGEKSKRVLIAYKEMLVRKYGSLSYEVGMKEDKKTEQADKIIKTEIEHWGEMTAEQKWEELIEDKALLKLEKMYKDIKNGEMTLDYNTRRKIVFEANKVRPANIERKKEICKCINNMFRHSKEIVSKIA